MRILSAHFKVEGKETPHLFLCAERGLTHLKIFFNFFVFLFFAYIFYLFYVVIESFIAEFIEIFVYFTADEVSV